MDLTLENILKKFRISPIDIIPLKGDGSERKFFRIILTKRNCYPYTSPGGGAW